MGRQRAAAAGGGAGLGEPEMERARRRRGNSGGRKSVELRKCRAFSLREGERIDRGERIQKKDESGGWICRRMRDSHYGQEKEGDRWIERGREIREGESGRE